MSLTVQSLLGDALSLVGANSSDEPATSSDYQLALRTCNNMLGRWAAKRLLLRGTIPLEFTMTRNKASYSISPSGADITAPIPTRIMSGYYRDSGTIDTPVEIITREEYDNLPDKSISIGPPVYIAFDPGAAQQATPKVYIYVYMAPDQAYFTHLEVDAYLTTFVNLDDVVTFDQVYYEAIIYNLAVRVFRHFHGEKAALPADVVAIANGSMNDLRALNAVRIQSALDLPGKPSTFNIDSNTWS